MAAAVTCGVHRLAAEHAPGGTAIGYVLVGVLTAGFALLVARTVIGLINGTFLARIARPANLAGDLPPAVSPVVALARHRSAMTAAAPGRVLDGRDHLPRLTAAAQPLPPPAV